LKDSEKKPINSLQWNPTRFLGRLFLACLAVVAFFYIIGSFYIRLFPPVFSWEIENLNPEYKVVNSDIIKNKGINYLQIDIKIKAPKSQDLKEPLESSHVTRHKAQASALCIAPIIIFSLILAWPALPLNRRLKAFVFSLPLIVLIECLDYPIIFMSNIASVYSDNTAANAIFKIWSHILNNGGRQFLSLIAFLLVIAPHYLKQDTKPIPAPIKNPVGTARNAPCPCGSGIKYKNCCLSKSSNHKSTGN
jgi:hypothetical protein